MGKTKNSDLFVADEDEEMVESYTDTSMAEEYVVGEEEEEEKEEEMVEDDPIMESIPLVISQGPRIDQGSSIHLLQYMGKMKDTENTKPSEVMVKPESQFILVKYPLRVDQFYDESRAEQWGLQVKHHEHNGGLNNTGDGLYAAKLVKDDENNQKRFVLVPIDTTSQLRPSFQYLDDLENQKLLQRKESVDTTQTSSVHILQSSAKSNAKSNPEGITNPALGESLKHVKQFEQEPWVPISWEKADSFNLKPFLTTKGPELITDDSMDTYLENLIGNK